MKQKVLACQLLANAQEVGGMALKMEQLHQKPPSSPRRGGCHLCDKSEWSEHPLRRRLAIVLRHTGIPSSEHPAGSAPSRAGKTEVKAPKWIFFHLVPLRTCAWHGRRAEKEKRGCTREFCDSLIFQPLDYPPIRAPGTWDVEICTERCSSDCIIRNSAALAGRWTG